MLTPITAACALLLAAPAAAQEITASALLPEAGWPVGDDIVAVGEDVVILLPPTERRPSYLVERRDPELGLIWSEEVDLSRSPGGGGLYDPEADRESWVRLQASEEVIWIFYMEGLSLKARAIDPATGAASDVRDVARIGDERATRERFASTRLSGSHPHPGAVPFAASPGGRYFVVGTTAEDGAQSVRILDEDLEVLRDFALDEGGLYQVRFQVTDGGSLLMTGAEKGSSELLVIRVPIEGEATTAIVALGERRTVRDLRLLEGDLGSVYGVALSGSPGKRIDALHLFAVDGAAVRFEQVLDDAFLKEHLDTGLLGLGFRGLDGFVRLVRAERDPDGNLLIGLRPMYVVDGKNTSTELSRFSPGRGGPTWHGDDTTLLSFDGEGELRWAVVAPTEVKTDNPFELATPASFSEERLRLAYRSQAQGDPALKFIDIDLADGGLGEPGPLTPRFSSGSPFLGPLSLGDGDEWLIATRVPGSRRVADRSILERVDLGISPAQPADPSPDPSAGPGDPDWLVGSAAGYAAGMDNPRRDTLRGLAWGLAGGLAGVAAGRSVYSSNQNTGAAVFTIGLFYAGSAYGAGRLGGQPGEDWWTTRSGAYQAGYIDGYTSISQQRARRWALIGGGAVSLIGVLGT